MRKILLFFALLLCSLQVWAQTFTVAGVTYKIIDATHKTVAIGSGGGPAISTSTSGAFTIPASVIYNGDTYTVSSVGDFAFHSCSSLTSIAIPSSVNAIGEWAFYSCKALSSLTMPSSVTSIGQSAFGDCTALTSLTIPSSVTFIGNTIFDGCSALASILVDSSNLNYSSSDGVLFNKAMTTLIKYPIHKPGITYTIPSSVSTIDKWAFHNSTALTSITIPASVNSIGDVAFGDCTALTSIVMPSSVTSIGDIAFGGCSSLTSITIPSSVTSIGKSAFNYCTSLTSIAIPLSVISIGSGAFEGCSALTAISVDSSNSTYSSGDGVLFNKAKTTLIRYPAKKQGIIYTIPSSVTSIGGYAFEYCTFLTSIVIPSSVTLIGDYAVKNCSALTSITIPSSVTAIGNGTFMCCTTLTSLAIPSSVTSIGEAAFYNCPALTSITIPSSITKIDRHAFYVCSGLKSVYVENTLPSNIKLGASIFENVPTNTCILYVPAGSKLLYTTADQWKDFISIVECPLYAVAVSANIAEGGVVSGAANYMEKASCSLTATAKPGYVFTGWTESGNVVSANSKYTFTVTSVHTLVANFTAIAVTVTQPTELKLSGSLEITPATGFTYSLDGTIYQNSNVFPSVPLGTYNVTLKSTSDSTVSLPVYAVVNSTNVIGANNYQVKATNCTCRGANDGAITVSLVKALQYEVHVKGTSTSVDKTIQFANNTFSMDHLMPDTYTLSFKVPLLANYEQNFTVTITQPEDLSVLKMSAAPNSMAYSLSGGANYYVAVNDKITQTQEGAVLVALLPGENRIRIYTDKLCQGVYDETVYNDVNGQLSLFPNPTMGKIAIGVPGNEDAVTVEVLSQGGQLLRQHRYPVPQNRVIEMDLSDFINGIYLVRINGSVIHRNVRVVKQ